MDWLKLKQKTKNIDQNIINIKFKCEMFSTSLKAPLYIAHSRNDKKLSGVRHTIR